MSYFWGLQPQSSQNDCSIEECDYDRNPYKNVLFPRIVIMIAVLIKCTIYEDYNHNHSPHKNVMFLSLYKIATMITILFITTAPMIAVFTKVSHIWIFMRTMIP